MQTIIMTQKGQQPALSTCAVVACALVMGACSLPAVHRPTPIPSDRLEIVQRIVVLADICVVEWEGNRPGRLDFPKNKVLGNTMVETTVDGLMALAYPVDESQLSTFGMSGDGEQLRVVWTLADRELKNDSLPVHSPPFYVHKMYDADSLVRESLLGLMRQARQRSIGKDTSLVFPDAIEVGEWFDCDALFLLLADVYNPTVGFQIADEVAARIVTLGLVGGSDPRVTIELRAFDVLDGMLIWEDRASTKFDSITQESVREVAQELVRRLRPRIVH